MIVERAQQELDAVLGGATIGRSRVKRLGEDPLGSPMTPRFLGHTKVRAKRAPRGLGVYPNERSLKRGPRQHSNHEKKALRSGLGITFFSGVRFARAPRVGIMLFLGDSLFYLREREAN
jgi:hypothetical protein